MNKQINIVRKFHDFYDTKKFRELIRIFEHLHANNYKYCLEIEILSAADISGNGLVNYITQLILNLEDNKITLPTSIILVYSGEINMIDIFISKFEITQYRYRKIKFIPLVKNRVRRSELIYIQSAEYGDIKNKRFIFDLSRESSLENMIDSIKKLKKFNKNKDIIISRQTDGPVYETTFLFYKYIVNNFNLDIYETDTISIHEESFIYYIKYMFKLFTIFPVLVFNKMKKC